ncbi:MAG: tetratricopeptide repeat protein, partial [Paracoccaceae bacterium]|nr:tetratricopeptide repeat protein [Paracoccaceae bacterium]
MRNNGLGFVIALAVLGGCTQGGFAPSQGDRVFAPGVAGQSQVDQLVVGHRLMDAGEHELALAAYSRAAVQQGFNVDTLSALGSANLRLGRLNQAERLLRRAVKEDANYAPAWNNLGVLLMEQGKTTEARQIFRRAFATDN